MKPGAGDHHRSGLYSAAQVRELDRRAIEQAGIPGYTLMQRAARASFEQMRGRWPDARRLAVLCGPGNNGGDGYEIACLARAAGLHVDLVRVGAVPASGDAVTAYAAWIAAGGEVREFSNDFVDHVLSQAEVICDAIFGIGIARPVTGVAAKAIEAINERRSDQAVLSVDLPSGLDADTGAVQGVAVRSDLTVSFIGRKLGLYSGAGPERAGQCEFSDLGVPAGVLDSMTASAELLSAEELRVKLPRRARDSHKGTHGHALLIGGDIGMTGAVLLACRGALRSGAGLVTVMTRPEHAVALAAAQPEAMFRGLEQSAELDAYLERADAVGIGPGLGQTEWGAQLLDRCLRSNANLLLDADALNLLARTHTRLSARSVITPHPGEAARLLEISTSEVQANRLAAAHTLHERCGAVVVLKGAGTLIVGERVALCPYGNPGMGVGGMGDVLSGVIVALMAQGLDPESAASTGVLVHALAGDRAAMAGERGMLPTDLIDALRSVVNP
ncbi:MAG: NAD(P)H-hydrate dehydratase [Panacagrimonas sp.]